MKAMDGVIATSRPGNDHKFVPERAADITAPMSHRATFHGDAIITFWLLGRCKRSEIYRRMPHL